MLSGLVQVKPYGQLEVTPEDFPLFLYIHGLDDDRLEDHGQAMATGVAWPGSLIVTYAYFLSASTHI